jgi:hypothetical protein
MDIEDPQILSDILIKQKEIDIINDKMYRVNKIKRAVCFISILSLFWLFGVIIKHLL